MLDAFDEFRSRIAETESLIEMNKSIAELRALIRRSPHSLGEVPNELLEGVSSMIETRLLAAQYEAVMSRLYAVWERFIEELVIGYARAHIEAGTACSSKIMKEHLVLSLEVLKFLAKGSTRYAHLNTSTTLTAAARVEEGHFDQVNYAALSHHSMNLRSAGVAKLLSQVGCGEKWMKLSVDQELGDALEDMGLDRPHAASGAARFPFIDDICERRNEIAHGGQVQQLLNQDFQKTYCRALLITGGRLLSILLEEDFSNAAHGFVRIGAFEKRYRHGRVLILKVDCADGVPLSIGDDLVVCSASGSISRVSITSMQLDDQTVERVVPLLNVSEVGVGVSGLIPRSGEVYLRWSTSA